MSNDQKPVAPFDFVAERERIGRALEAGALTHSEHRRLLEDLEQRHRQQAIRLAAARARDRLNV